jgi:hypothetical protein
VQALRVVIPRQSLKGVLLNELPTGSQAETLQAGQGRNEAKTLHKED